MYWVLFRRGVFGAARRAKLAGRNIKSNNHNVKLYRHSQYRDVNMYRYIFAAAQFLRIVKISLQPRRLARILYGESNGAFYCSPLL